MNKDRPTTARPFGLGAEEDQPGLEDRMGYTFRNPTLLQTALTHGSAQPPGVVRENERLELLGDAVLDLVVTEGLLRLYPDWDEGRLSRQRALLVQTRSLARIARRLGIERALRLGHGEAQSGGRAKPSILAAAFEAVLGALYLDGGLNAARELVEREILAAEDVYDAASQSDWKTALQEETQRRWRVLPSYRLTGCEGPPHAPVFTVEVDVQGRTLGRGEGRSKREAEQAAARQALQRLEAEGD